MARRPIKDAKGKVVGYSNTAGAGKRKERNFATDANRKPKRERVRLTHSERREVAKIVGSTAKGITRSAKGVQRSAERVVGGVLAQSEREKQAKALAEIERVFGRQRPGRLGGITSSLRGIERGLMGELQELPGRAARAAKDPRDTLDALTTTAAAEYLTGTRTKEEQEKDLDLLLGKAASNLIFHGERSHLPEAGLEIASILPIGRGGKFIVQGASKLAKTEKVVPDEVVAPNVPEVLGKARGVAKKDVSAANVERGKRLRKGLEKMEAKGGGEAGEIALLQQLRGELPRTEFTDLAEGVLPRETFDDLIRQVQTTDVLSDWEKRAAIKGLRDAHNKGKAPSEHQIVHLERVFGSDKGRTLREWRGSKSRLLGDVVGLPRSLQTTLDVSYAMRQGLVPLVRWPDMARHIPGSGIRPLVSESHYQAGIKKLHQEPFYKESIGADDARRLERVDYTELNPLDAQVREEGFPSPLAEKIPVYGRAVRGSSRSFSLLGDVFRYNTYVKLRKTFEKRGLDVNDPAIQDAMARMANSFNGRGDLGRAARYAPALNKAFFAPRLIKSRLDLLNPVWYAKLPKGTRREAVRSMIHLGAFVSGVLGAGYYLLGGDVELDPRSSDFAKLQLANTRLDVAGGFQQYIRGTAQILSGQTKSSTSGEVRGTPWGPAAFGDPTRYDVFEKFGWSKASPPAKFIHDMAMQQDWKGAGIDWKKYPMGLVSPLVAQDAYELYKDKRESMSPEQAAKYALLGYAVSAFGVSSQTYKDESGEKKAKKRGQEFKEWKQETEKKLGGPLNAVILRAKQTQYRISDEQQELKEKYGVESVRDSYRLQLEARVKVLAGMADVDMQMWDELLGRISEDGAKSLIPKIEKELGLTPLYKFQARSR